MSSKRTKTLAQADPILAGYAKEIRARDKRLCALAKRTVDDIDKIGELLTKAKWRIRRHGDDWLPWLDREFRRQLRWSEDMAQRYMRVHELLSKSKNRKLRNLGPSVLYLLARKSMPEAVRDAVAAQVEAGEKVTLKAVKNTMRIESHYRPVAKTTIRSSPIMQEAVPLNVQIMSPECVAPPGYELTRHRDLIFHGFCRLADMITAAGDVTYIIVADVSEAERKALDTIKQFIALFTQAQITREHSSVN